MLQTTSHLLSAPVNPAPQSITLHRGRNVAAAEEKSFVTVCVICMKEFKCDLKVTFLSTNVISVPGCAVEEYLKKKKFNYKWRWGGVTVLQNVQIN